MSRAAPLDRHALPRILATAPWCSDELLDAVEAAIDAGWEDLVDRVFDVREQGMGDDKAAEAVKENS